MRYANKVGYSMASFGSDMSEGAVCVGPIKLLVGCRGPYAYTLDPSNAKEPSTPPT